MADRSTQLQHSSFVSKLGALCRFVGFLGLTLPLMPVQAILLRTNASWATRFPHWYHQKLCRLLGIRLHIDGALDKDRAVLLVANHSSWLDIPVISAAGPVSFIAKTEVRGWPLVSSLARLQRTVFVNRRRRTTVGKTANEILARLERGDKIVLFAEGTSSDGNRLLPFKTSLFAAAKPTTGVGAARPQDAVVQTLVAAYTHIHGVPLSRSERAQLVGWYGDMELLGHAWALLQAGPLDVHIKFGVPQPLCHFADRKELARQTEAEMRDALVEMLRCGGHETGSASVNRPREAGSQNPGDGD